MYFKVENNGMNLVTMNTTFRRWLRENEVFKGERHDFWELVFVEEGELTVAEDEKVYEMKKGQIIFHKPMEFHRFWSHKNVKTKLIIMSFSVSGDIIEPLSHGVFSLSIGLNKKLEELVNDIQNTFCLERKRIESKQDNDVVAEMKAALNLQLFLLSALDQTQNRVEQHYGITAGNYKNTVRVLEEHIYEKLCVEDIAALTNLSVSNLKKTFSIYAGCGVMHYFNTLKIIEATKLLQTDMSISQISEKLGYTSPNYFSVAFKKQTGLLPIQYRKNMAL